MNTDLIMARSSWTFLGEIRSTLQGATSGCLMTPLSKRKETSSYKLGILIAIFPRPSGHTNHSHQTGEALVDHAWAKRFV